MKFGTSVRPKPSNDRSELDRARSKNNIAENLFALGHETHNKIEFSNGCRQIYHGSHFVSDWLKGDKSGRFFPLTAIVWN